MCDFHGDATVHDALRYIVVVALLVFWAGPSGRAIIDKPKKPGKDTDYAATKMIAEDRFNYGSFDVELRGERVVQTNNKTKIELV